MNVGDSSHSTSTRASMAKMPPSFSWGSSLLTRSKIRRLSSVIKALKFSRDIWRASISTALRRSCIALRLTCSRLLRKSDSARSVPCDSCTRAVAAFSFFEVIDALIYATAKDSDGEHEAITHQPTFRTNILRKSQIHSLRPNDIISEALVRLGSRNPYLLSFSCTSQYCKNSRPKSPLRWPPVFTDEPKTLLFSNTRALFLFQRFFFFSLHGAPSVGEEVDPLTHAHRSIGYRNRNPQPLAEYAARLMHLRVYDNRDGSRQSTPSLSLFYSLTNEHRSIGYRNLNPQTLAESSTRLMYLRVYDSRDSSHQSAPSPSLYY